MIDKNESEYNEILQFILQIIGKQGTGDSTLVDLGIDSLSYVKLITTLENEYDIEFKVEDLVMNNIKTIRNLIEKTIKIMRK